MHSSSSLPDPDWLTEVLRQSGRLPCGCVTAVDVRASGAFNSNTQFLRLSYSSEADAGLPADLVLKRNLPEPWGVEAGAAEVGFYQLVAAMPGHPTVTVPCFAAAYDSTSGDSYLLLEDISASHAAPLTRDQQVGIVDGVPAQDAIDAVTDTLASLHAFWWNRARPDLEFITYGYWNRDAERFGKYHERRAAAWADLRTKEIAWLPEEIVALYDQVLARLPLCWERQLKDRFRAGLALTLVHGDAYFANFMCPRVPMSAPTYLLDWQSPCFDIGAYDLANLLVTFWTPDQRAQDGREERILRRYHARLVAGGVSGYSWEDLCADYRHGIIFWLLMPVQDRLDGSGPDYWWPKMRCIAGAFHDWNCEELL